MRIVAGILLALLLPAHAQQTPVEAPRIPSQYVAQPPPVTSGISNDRDVIMSIIAERDRQYDQRFKAQELAMTTALIAADKAIAAAFAAADKATAAAFSAAKEAVEKAERASEKRFESVNEFRKALTDQTSTFAPRVEMDIRFRAIDEKITIVTQRELASTARLEGAQNLWIWIFAIVGASLTFLAFVFKMWSPKAA